MKGLRMTPEAYEGHQARIHGPRMVEANPGERKRKAKYGNQKTFVDGMVFASKREADRYAELKLMLAAGEITKLRLQPHIPCDVNGVHVCTAVPDFAYTKRGDSRETFEDSKGHRTALFILKKKLVFACTGIEVIEV